MSVVPFRFAGLPRLTRAQAALWNWFHAAFPSRPEWEPWCREVLGELLPTPTGHEAWLDQSHCLEPQREKVRHNLVTNDATIGRAADNDIVLGGQAIAKQHARLTEQDGDYWLEDRGSTLGTYVHDKKLAPGNPVRLGADDQFTIFPYTLTLRLRQTWTAESQVELADATLSWKEWDGSAPVGAMRFGMRVHPAGSVAVLELDRAFVAGLVERLLHPIENGGRLGAECATLAEFVLLSVLDRANQDLAFPFRFQLFGADSAVEPPRETAGLEIAFTLRLSGLSGAVRLFLPEILLTGMRDASTPGARTPLPVCWRFPVVAGCTELTPDELAQVEVGDIVLITPDAALLWPGDGRRGWRAARSDKESARLTIADWFDTEFAMEDKDLDQLPVRIHVVLGEKELVLSELKELTKGSIIELDRAGTDPVRLAVNGKLVGEGELVEIDNKLGVKILSWKGA